MMYEELVKVLRETDFSDGCPCGAEQMCNDGNCVIWQAADAIENLQLYADLYKDLAENYGKLARDVIDKYRKEE